MTHSAQNPPNAPMNTQNKHKSTNKAPIGAQPPPRSPKTRAAIDLLIRTGMTQRWVAHQVGMDENALSRALKKPAIAAYYEQQQILALQDAKPLRKRGEIAALHTALDLLQNSKSDTVKARMVEFFAGGGGKGVTVNVDNRQITTGYEVAKPNQRIVDVVDIEATDQQSVVRDDESPMK